jgi:hypothetical protein
MLDGPLAFAQFHSIFQVFPLVILLFPAAEGDFNFHQALLEIDPQGDNGSAATLNGLFPFADFPLVEKQLAGTPLSIRTKLSLIWAIPWRMDLTSVPFRAIPASRVSSTK